MLTIEPQGVGTCLSGAYDFAIYVLEDACDKAMHLTVVINDNGGVHGECGVVRCSFLAHSRGFSSLHQRGCLVDQQLIVSSKLFSNPRGVSFSRGDRV